MVINNPLIRPYFFGGVGGGTFKLPWIRSVLVGGLPQPLKVNIIICSFLWAPGPRQKTFTNSTVSGLGIPPMYFSRYRILLAALVLLPPLLAWTEGGVGAASGLGGGGSGLVAGQWKNPGTKRPVTGTPKGVLNLMVKGRPLTHPWIGSLVGTS